MEEPAYYTIGCAGIKDVPAMLDFEQRYFDSCWQSKPDVLKGLIEMEPAMFRICKVAQTLKGYYGIIPLPFEVWQKVIKGQIQEDDALPYILPFEAPDIYLYIYSVIVDLSDRRHKTYTRALVRDFTRRFILRPWHKNSNVKAIGAFTVSEGGRRLVERSNFIYKGGFQGKNGKKVRSYAIKRENLIQQVRGIRKQQEKRFIA